VPKFTPDHEWIAVHGDFAMIGIAEYAPEQLGELVFVELPKLGRSVVAGECAAVVESAKAALEVLRSID
jgi:glycine cleavage system H protein